MKFINFKYQILMAALILMAATSCQKTINIDVANAPTQLIIEGNVTSLTAIQTVKISQSVPFYNTNVFPAVRGATVTIADSKGNSYKLTETTTPGTYGSAKFAGKIGYIYTVTVVVNGVTYTGSSTMPAQVNFDQLTYRDDFFNNNQTKVMSAHFQDPPNVPNQYRFVLYVNSVQANAIFATNDNFSDGSYIDLDLFQSDIKIKLGDTVRVDMQCIDKPVFTYFYSLSQQGNNGNATGTTPSNPPSNLSSNVLGYFSAHTTQTQTVIIN